MKNLLMVMVLFTVVASTHASTLLPGTASTGFQELQKNTLFNEVSPPAQFLSSLMAPLSEVTLPFDKAKLKRAINFAGVYVAPNWQLTTLHRLPWSNNSVQPFLFESRFSTQPFDIGGIGTLLFALGHPLLQGLSQKGVPFISAINQVPLPERPDFALLRNPEGSGEFLTVAQALAVNEEVIVVHSPFLEWLSDAEKSQFRAKAPFVSLARVQTITGNVARIDVFASQGSSGGTVLNKRGEVVGILSASARTKGKAPMAFMMILDQKKRELVKRAMELR